MELSEKKLQELKEKKISIEELNDRYFIKSRSNPEIKVDNILRVLNENVCSFEELVNKFKSIKDDRNNPCLYKLVQNDELFENLIQNNRLNKDDLKYLLNRIDEGKLYWLCNNTPLIKYILNEFLFNKETVDRFNRMIERLDYWFRYHNIHNIFELIEYANKNDEEILKLNKAYRYIYAFDFARDQKLELIELINDNEIARNKFKEIINNNLEDKYSFEQLMMYLKKKEKKNILNI